MDSIHGMDDRRGSPRLRRVKWMLEEGISTFRAVVAGRVQGVGFRLFVARAARRLGLTGSVRNLPDGRVEVHAAGSRAELTRLEQSLRKGPALGRIDQLELDWDWPVGPRSDFTIEY